MNDVTIPKNTTLDVLDGVSAIDDNGNPITDIDYSGTFDKQASGDIVSISDGDNKYPVKSLKVTLEPIQSGSGTPSPDNVRPISGHTECVTEVCGANVFDGTVESGKWISDYTTGEVASTASSYNVTDFIPVKPNTAYYMMQTGSSRNIWYDADKNAISMTSWAINDRAKVITSPSNAYYIRFTVTNAFLDSFGLNYPSTDHNYHAYQGNTYTTTLGRTVYGGDVEVVEGELTDKMGFITFDGTEDWYSVTAGTNANRALCAVVPNAPSGAYNWDLYGSYIVGTGTAQSMPPLWQANFNPSGHFLVGIPTTITSVADWKAYLAQNPLQLCYELATPQTYQLDPQTISLLHGTNNVLSDGEIEMVYSVELPTDGEVSYPLEGEYEITYSASDKCGNIGEAIRHITVQ